MPSLTLLLTITSAVATAFGFAFLVLPELTLAPFGAVLDPVGALIARLYGAMHLGLGLINWLARDLAEAAGRRAVSAGNLVYFALAAVVAAAAAVLGIANSLILANTLAFGLLALAFGRYVIWSDANA